MKPENIIFYTVSHIVPQLILQFVIEYTIYYTVSHLLYRICNVSFMQFGNNGLLRYIMRDVTLNLIYVTIYYLQFNSIARRTIYTIIYNLIYYSTH